MLSLDQVPVRKGNSTSNIAGDLHPHTVRAAAGIRELRYRFDVIAVATPSRTSRGPIICASPLTRSADQCCDAKQHERSARGRLYGAHVDTRHALPFALHRERAQRIPA